MNPEQQPLFGVHIGNEYPKTTINRMKVMKKSKQEIKNRILTFTKRRVPENSVCTSEVTRDLFSDVWRNHLDDVKHVASELQSEKLIKTTQNGRDVRIDEAKGPIRLSILNNDR